MKTSRIFASRRDGFGRPPRFMQAEAGVRAMQLDAWDLLLFSLVGYVATLFAYQQLFARRRAEDRTTTSSDSRRSGIA